MVSGGDSGISAGKLPLEDSPRGWVQEIFCKSEIQVRAVLGPGGEWMIPSVRKKVSFPAFVSPYRLVL